jgi:hypothetical protein
VSKHFEEGKGGNVHRFGVVDEVCVVLCSLRLAELKMGKHPLWEELGGTES